MLFKHHVFSIAASNLEKILNHGGIFKTELDEARKAMQMDIDLNTHKVLQLHFECLNLIGCSNLFQNSPSFILTLNA